MTNNSKSSTGRRLLSAGHFALVACLTTTLLAARVCLAQPGLGISAPPDGAAFIAGGDIPLTAVVTNDGSTITGMDFRANGTLLGAGQPDPHGEWEYADESHLSVMNWGDGEMMDYSAASGFFSMNGVFVAPGVFVGSFHAWVEGNSVEGAVTVTLSFTANGELNAVMDGDAPLGKRTLSAGVRFGDEIPYMFTWPTVAAGSYTLEAVAKYGASQTVTSASVHITVVGGKPHAADYVKNLTRTAAHDEAWDDQDNQLAFAWSGVHVAWRASAPSADNSVTTNRIYYTRSQNNGVSFEPWVLLEERTESGYTLSGQWMAVDGYDVHIIILSEGYADEGGNHGQRLQYHRSTDGGATFGAPVLLGSTAPGEYFGAVLIAASGARVSVAIQFGKESHNPSIKFLHSADRGANFATTLLSPVAPALSQLVQNGSQVSLLWQDVYISGTWSDGAAQVACSTDGGTNFTVTSLEDVPPGTALHADQPRIAVGGTNVIAVFIFENTNATPARAELHLRRSSDSGLTFGSPVNLAPGLDPAVEVPADGQYDLAISGTNVSVVFGTTGNQLYSVRSTDGGATFQPPQLIADANFNQGAPMALTPRLAQHSDLPDSLHLLWSGSWYTHSTDAGATWTPPVNLMLQYSGWLYSPTPQVAADSMGALHWNVSGFWNASGYGDNDVLYRSFKHAAAPAGNLNLAAQFGQEPNGFLRFDNLQIPGVPALDLTSALTVECWVKLSANTNALNADIVSRDSVSISPFPIFRLGTAGDDPANRWFLAEIYDGGLGPVAVANRGLIARPEIWYHLALSFDSAAAADNLKLYVNGDLQGAGTYAEALLASPAPIIVSRFLDGAVDDLRFWNRALSAQEIRDRLTGPLAGNESGLAAYYTLNGTWAESTGNGLPAVPMYQETFGAGADVQPLLQVELVSASQVRLSWTTFGATYTPKFTSDLGNPDWQLVPETPVLADGRWTLTTEVVGSPRFFRLQR